MGKWVDVGTQVMGALEVGLAVGWVGAALVVGLRVVGALVAAAVFWMTPPRDAEGADVGTPDGTNTEGARALGLLVRGRLVLGL